MTSKVLSHVIALGMLAASLDSLAVPGDNCAMIEQSVSLGKAVVSETTVFVAVAAKDPTIVETKFPVKTAKRKLQSMFMKYCSEFSGYKTFQVETRGAVSGSVICNGKTNYAFAVRKSEITIKEISGAESVPTVDIPDLDSKNDLFEEFK